MKFALHIQKNEISSIKNLENEQNRTDKHNRNEQIDRTRSKFNYELIPNSHKLFQKTKENVEQSRKNGSRIQKNSIVDISSIITVRSDYAEQWGDEKVKSYFETCIEYYKTEFGENNITSAIVHVDETSPHMHLHFTPINQENGKLQARKVMTRAQIIKMQSELPKFLKERGFNVERGEHGKEKGYVDTIPELKRKSIHDIKQLRLDKARLEVVSSLTRVMNQKGGNAVKTASNELKTVQEQIDQERKTLEHARKMREQYEFEMNQMFQRKMAIEEDLVREKEEHTSIFNKNRSLRDENNFLELSIQEKEEALKTVSNGLKYINDEKGQVESELEFLKIQTHHVKNKLAIDFLSNTEKVHFIPEKTTFGKATGRFLISEDEAQNYINLKNKAIKIIENHKADEKSLYQIIFELEKDKKEYKNKAIASEKEIDFYLTEYGKSQSRIIDLEIEKEFYKKEYEKLKPKQQEFYENRDYGFER